MRFRQLGTSNLRVSEISLGTLIFSGETPAEAARACIDAAFDVGINFFDTANMYGRGQAEVFLGEALSGRQRDSYLLATKVYFSMSDDEGDKGLSAAQIHKQLDASLTRLKTDYVDLYQCHRYDDETSLEETMEALTQVIKAGKVRYIGFSEWPLDKIKAAMDMAGVEHFVSSQPQYSIIWRSPETELIPYCASHGISQLAYSPLTQGVLSGKYRPGETPPEASRATHHYMKDWIGNYLDVRILGAVQKLKFFAELHGMTTPQLALAWVLRKSNVASAIIGATSPEHVISNARTSELAIDPTLLSKADQIMAEAAIF